MQHITYFIFLLYLSYSLDSHTMHKMNFRKKNQFFAQLLNDNENSPQKYTISKVNPIQLPTSGSISIEIQIDPPFEGPCFCKFDDIIVKANAEKSGIVTCEVPKHKSGNAFVYFSKDSEIWSEGYPVTYVLESQTLLIIVLIIGGTCFGSLVMFWWQMRQCKNSTRRNRDNMNGYDNRLDYEDDDDYQPLKRKSNRESL